LTKRDFAARKTFTRPATARVPVPRESFGLSSAGRRSVPVEKLRKRVHESIDQRLGPVTRILARLGIQPNQVTVAGTLICLVSPALVVADRLVLAGVVFLTGSALDLIDGALARSQGKVTDGGAFLDSTLDRITEGALFAAIAYHFAQAGAAGAAALTVVALLGALLVSYTRARAEALGANCKVGIITRPERVVLLGFGLCFGLLEPIVYLLVALTAITVAQRIHHSLRELDAKL
jgi:CDP-diacylglycerol--glycerol-3-phosphate 3-phosphatidyltransferase